ncbi:mitochondrial import inner membrane translocase subunit Tim9 isoform X1 [Syngnathus scovelli]
MGVTSRSPRCEPASVQQRAPLCALRPRFAYPELRWCTPLVFCVVKRTAPGAGPASGLVLADNRVRVTSTRDNNTLIAESSSREEGSLLIPSSNMTVQVSESDQIKQFKEFLGTYNKLTENCFMDCVKDFTSRDVRPEESSCSESCLQKYLKMTQRISMRFQEYHIQQNEALAAKAGLLAQPR